MADKRKSIEYLIYTASVIAILAVILVPANDITGQVIAHSIDYETAAKQTSVEIKNTDKFQWNNVNIVLEDEDGIEYNCPAMLYLKSGSTAVINTAYCFSKSNTQMTKKPVKVSIVADEGSSSFIY